MTGFKNLLYAIDLNDDHVTSVNYALKIARLFQSRIHMLYVNDAQAGYRHPTDREDAVALKVKNIVPDLLLEGQDIIYAVAKGNTVQEIVRYAEEQQIDLILIGHKYRGKLYSSLFDSTDIKIIDEARLPVLAIPEK
jgi:nucleotide-binding universal stress UspA family protein